MKKNGPIIIVDDDSDDHLICKEAFMNMGVSNEIIFFTRCQDALNYLLENIELQPFIIICDINLPQLNGIELKKMIDNNAILKRKSIPFVHYSTSGNQSLVERAFENNIQGFFVKENSMEAITRVFKKIIDYWSISRHPRG
jgi:CheY-like chemotaxis protein